MRCARVSIPKRVLEALNPRSNAGQGFKFRGIVSIPKRVLEALNPAILTHPTHLRNVSIPKRVLEALNLQALNRQCLEERKFQSLKGFWRL